MNDHQWQQAQNAIAGKADSGVPVGFIIDSPWLPGWFGISILDYFTNDELWFESNKKVVETFPDVIFLPGFWAEYGMCTEPSAFGAKCSFPRNEFPHADKVIYSADDIDQLAVPNPEKDGLAPFIINRLRINRKNIEKLGHKIRFAVARGPLNIASFLMGTTEFLIALRTDIDKVHKLLETITEYVIKWLRLQKQEFDTIDGILILDDIVGFCGEQDFQDFAFPYLKRIYNSFDASVRFLHNDAEGRVCAAHLSSLGINMFNFSFLHSLEQMKEWTQNNVVLVGNIPPRDVLAAGSPDDVRKSVHQALTTLDDLRYVILSCGGGMPDGVSTENIKAFTQAARKH